MLDQYNNILLKSNAAIALAQKAIKFKPGDLDVIAKANEAIRLAQSAIEQAVKADLSKTSEESLFAIHTAIRLSNEALVAANKA
jgi:hypothetical protein